MHISRLPFGVAIIVTPLLLSGCSGNSPEAALSDSAGKPYSADQLYARMEEKLSKSRTLRFSFEATAQRDGKGASLVKGSAAFAEGNKMRLDILEAPEEFGPKGTLVSDGTDKNPQLAGKTQAKADEYLSLFCRYGAAFGWLTSPDGIHLADPKPRAFKLGPKEKLDGRTVQVIEYDLNVDWPKGEVLPPQFAKPYYRATLWIDGGTGLPLKREVVVGEGSIVEVYKGMKLDANIDPKTFETTK